MEEKFKGLIIKTTEIKDADKLASIFSFESGLISAKFTGVKKDKAKFKAVAQPFVFAEFCANKNGNTRTITSADIINTFPNIMLDYNKTMCGYIVLDIIKTILPNEKAEQNLFSVTVDSLTKIETENPYVATIDFILKFMYLTGVELQFVDTNYPYLDMNIGNFTKERTAGNTQIDKKVYLLLKEINEREDFSSISADEKTLKQVLHLLHNIIYLKYNEDIRSFQFI